MRRGLRTALAVFVCAGAFIGLASLADAPRRILDVAPGGLAETDARQTEAMPPLTLSEPATTLAPPTPGCAPDGHSAVVDRANQRAWLCAAGSLEYRGARIAFHSIPRYSDGAYVQSLDSVGTLELFGDSAGCIRLLPDDAVRLWDWLAVGDPVTVVS